MIKIIFLCHGNICRSPMAEFVMKDIIEKAGLSSEYVIVSAATSREEIGNDIHSGTKRVLKEHGIPFESRQARQITKADYDEFDYLVAMDYENLHNIARIVGNDKNGKVKLLMEFAGERREVADPWYTRNFEVTYNDVNKGCMSLFSFLNEDKKKV